MIIDEVTPEDESILPVGFVQLTPRGDSGTILIRAKCIHSLILVPEHSPIITADGVEKVDLSVIAVGVMGGKKFNFPVEEDVYTIMAQMARDPSTPLDVELESVLVEDKGSDVSN